MLAGWWDTLIVLSKMQQLINGSTSDYTKLILKLVIVLITMFNLICFSGCSKSEPISDTIENIDFETLKNEVNSGEAFILELAMSNCHYCKEFESECLNIPSRNEIRYLRLYLDNIDISELESLLHSNIDSVPVVSWIQDGKNQDNFPVSYQYSRKRLFQEWIDDNIAYFEVQ